MSNLSNDKTAEPLYTDKQSHCVMLVSRNKDNQHLENFEQRRTVFLTTREKDDPLLVRKFEHFKDDGRQGEMSRMYYSVNARDNLKTIREVQHYLLDNPEYNAGSLSALAVKCAMHRENASEKNRLFDFDLNDEEKLNEFVQDLKSRGADDVEVQKTPNGYAVVIKRGVDLRGLVDTLPDKPMKDKKDKGPWKWNNDEVGYKVDDLVLVTWGTK